MSHLKVGSTQSGADRRQYSRIEFDADVTLEQNSVIYHAELIDISLNGALISLPEGYESRTDKSCILSIKLSADAIITIQAALVHNSMDCLGFQCVSIDMGSIAVLRRLMEVNIDDPAAPERVLSELLQRQQGMHD